MMGGKGGGGEKGRKGGVGVSEEVEVGGWYVGLPIPRYLIVGV